MLEVLLGNKSAARVLLYFSRQTESYATEISKNTGTPLNMAQNQLERFEKGGILRSLYRGRRKVYELNPNCPFLTELKKILSKEIALRDPADGSYLSLRERVRLGEELYRQAVLLNPFPRPKPFAKSFESFGNYEKWKRRQKNPWLL